MDNKGILFIATSSNASPARGGRRRIVDVAHQVSSLGLAPRILCFLPIEQVIRGLKFWHTGKTSLQSEAKTPVSYWPMLPFTRFQIIAVINRWYCGLITVLICRFHNIKVTYGHGVRAASIALAAKGFMGTLRTIADIHGAVAAEYAYRKRLKPGDYTIQLLEKIEKDVLLNADHLIFVSHRMHHYYEDKLGQIIDNSSIIPCAVSTQFRVDPQERERMRIENRLRDKLLIVYAGSAVAYQLVDEMCLLFKAIHRHVPNAHFLILSHHCSQFEQFLKLHEINTVDYSILSVDHDAIFEHIQMGDVGLMLRDNSIVNKVASPTKFAEYLLCGLPVVTSAYVGDFSDVVKKYKLGFTVDLSELDQVDDVVNFLIDVRANRSAYAQRCTDFALDNLTWSVFGNRLFSIITGNASTQPSSVDVKN